MILQKYREYLIIYKHQNKLNYKKLAEKLHTTEAIASDIVNGRRSFVSIETAKAILAISGELISHTGDEADTDPAAEA